MITGRDEGAALNILFLEDRCKKEEPDSTHEGCTSSSRKARCRSEGKVNVSIGLLYEGYSNSICELYRSINPYENTAETARTLAVSEVCVNNTASETYSQIEAADDLIGSCFRGSGNLDPTLRYLLFAPLLSFHGLLPFGVEAREVQETLVRGIGNEAFLRTSSAAQKLGVILSPLQPSYVVNSYWSPIDSRRHNVLLRALPASPESVKEATAYAAMFFLLTYRGERLSRPLFSFVNYTSKRAPRKRSLAICYEESLPDAQRGWLHIPSILQSLPRSLGLNDILESQVLTHSIDELSLVVRRLISNTLWDENANSRILWVDQILDRLFQLITDPQTTLTPDVIKCIQTQHSELVALFEDPALTFEQVFFMIITQVIWRRAFPANYVYSFPTYVSKTCCVLTMGTWQAMSSEMRETSSSIARILFLHPLLLDYSDKEAKTKDTVFRRFLGHNLPKIVIAPALLESQRIKDVLGPIGATMQVSAALEAANRIQVLYQHYEQLLIALMPRRDPKDIFATRLQWVDLERDVLPAVRTVFEIMRGRILDRFLRERLELSVEIEKKLHFVGHSALLTEILINIVSNAIDAIDPMAVRIDQNRAVVGISISLKERFLEVAVSDRGAGFNQTSRNDLAQIKAVVSKCDESTLVSAIDELLEKRATDYAHEDHLGIGLLFTFAYLRSLLWTPDIQRAGDLQVHPRNEGGTTVIVTVPIDVAYRTARVIPARSDMGEAFATSESSKLCILVSEDEALCLLLKQSLPDYKFERYIRFTDSDLEKLNKDVILLIDVRIGDNNAVLNLAEASEHSFANLREYLASEKAPPCIKLLRRIALSDGSNAIFPKPVIVLLSEPLPPRLTQEALNLGVDWVWNKMGDFSRASSLFVSLEEIKASRMQEEVAAGRSPMSHESKVNRRVLVVENSRSVCETLRTLLEPKFELECVGQSYSGNNFRVTVSDAVRAYDDGCSDGGFLAAIIDLALDQESEKLASQMLSEHDSILQLVRGIDPNSPSLQDIIGGIQVIRELRKRNRSLPLFVFSNYVYEAEALFLIKTEIGNVRTIGKDQAGYEELGNALSELLIEAAS